MHKPRISILMSTYNDSRFIHDSIGSVIQQSFQDWEFLILNDASTDKTDSILKQYSKRDRRIIYIKNKKNAGLTVNLNFLISQAKGEYIARLDSDDIWSDKNKLKIQTEFLDKNPAYGLVGTLAVAIDLDKKELFEITYPKNDLNIRKIILKHNCFLHSSILMRKSILNASGNYNIAHRHSQDYDLILKIGKISKFYNIPKKMVLYRINPNGTSVKKYQEQLGEAIKIITAHKDQYPGYLSGLFFWNMRRIYPSWFRGSISRQIKKHITFFYKLSGA